MSEYTRPTRPAYREYRVTVSNGMGGRTTYAPHRIDPYRNPAHAYVEARKWQRMANDASSRIEYRDSALGEWQPLLMIAHHGQCGAGCSIDNCGVLMAYARGEGERDAYLEFLIWDDGEDSPAGEESPADTGHAYTFYVGSAPFYDAHTGSAAAYAIPAAMRHDAHETRDLVRGVWGEGVESVAAYELQLTDDETAQRIAYAMAISTGNDCVMVTRDLIPGEGDRAMSSVRRFVVRSVNANSGNRTLIGDGPGGYRFVPDVKGDEVAFLVWSDASVSAVES